MTTKRLFFSKSNPSSLPSMIYTLGVKQFLERDNYFSSHSRQNKDQSNLLIFQSRWYAG